jgi:hypothetical protein
MTANGERKGGGQAPLRPPSHPPPLPDGPAACAVRNGKQLRAGLRGEQGA